MKKLAVFLFMLLALFAKDMEERELFEELFTSLFHKKVIYVYTSSAYKRFLSGSKILVPVSKCKRADLVFGIIDKNCNKPTFVLNYYLFKKNKNVLGAFYWRKGRPQLRLRKKIILKYKLHIDKNFGDFLE